MKKNYIKLISIFLTVSIFSSLILFTSCLSTLSDFADGMLGGYSGKSYSFTNEEAITAMKDALVEGISSASRNLSKTDAYYKNAALKIMLPKEADPIIQILTQIPGGQTLANDVVLRLNRTAESAAKYTVSIFASSIKGMTVTDGVKIVTGRRDAATQYLRDKCYDKLVSLYKPKVSKALDQPLVAGVSASTAWSTLVTNYNKYGAIPNSVARLAGQSEPFPAVQVDLAQFATEKALDGLFVKIAEEEGKIRDNPFGYASDSIKKVFGSLRK